MIKTTKTTYCPKKLITNNYLLTIRRTSKKNIYLSSKMFHTVRARAYFVFEMSRRATGQKQIRPSIQQEAGGETPNGSEAL